MSNSGVGEALDIELHNPFIPKGEYLAGMIAAVSYVGRHTGRKKLKELVLNKLRVSDHAVTEQAYLQAAVELTVCAHFAQFFSDNFIYEEKINAPKDVDCSFESAGYKFNVEVKCADFSKKHEVDSGDGFKLGSLGRTDGFDQLFEELQELFGAGGNKLEKQQHMDNKLKGFLLSATEKFSVGINESELNILVVGCDDAMDMQKWLSYMYGACGLFTEESYFDSATYDNVDLVVLTNLYHRHKDVLAKDQLHDHWILNEAFNILCENPRSSKKFDVFNEFSKTIRHYTNELRAHVVEGDAPDFIKMGLAIPDFVGNKLNPSGLYYFQPYPAKEEQDG